MPSALIPELNGRRLSVDVALKDPTRILRERIAKLADDQLLLPKFFHQLGKPVEGGGMLYSVIQASDFYTSDVEKRTPGNEYKIVEGVDPDPQLAVVEDWGGKFQITDEQIRRNDVSYLDQQTTQIANTIARKIDTRAYAELSAKVTGSNVVPIDGNWDNLVFVGAADNITPSADRPSAHLSAAQLAADLQELGVRHDLVAVNPEQAHELRTAYGDGLDAMLKSAGVTLYSNPRITAGTVWALAAGQVGTVGFEAPLTVEVYDDRATRSKFVQAYAVPAFAVDKPYAAKKITLTA
ncbi:MULTISPECIES: major capsid protein [Gordonia]|uniref:major capsid protein n=1 Tax=Gordonia TaxID=2053 RepID=UPI00257B4EC1|nr:MULTISPECIES: major capsid protein [Gordonia]